MRPIVGYIKPYIPRMGVGIFFKFVGTIMELMIPWILSYILDYVVPQKNTRLVLFWGLLMVLSAIAALVGNILANRISASVARDTTRTLRHDLFKKISYLSSAQIDYFSIPSLEARLTTDSYNINQVIGMMQRLGIRAPILLIGGIAITMTLEPVLTWTMISVLPFIALVVWLVSRKGIPMYTDLQRGVDIMVRTVRENISGIRVIKALSKTEQEKEHFSQVNRDVVRRETKASVTMGITNPMMNLFLNVGLTLVIVVGAFRINAGKTQPGTIIAFLSYFTIILNAMLSVTRIFVMYSRASASAGRIYEVLNAPEDLTTKEEPAVEEEEHIVFDDVSFSYKGKTDNVSHISFKLKKGETLGIIGATGAGKTTIINLLMRFYDPQSGKIRMEGKDSMEITRKSLRAAYTMVLQDTWLFYGSIYDNIAFSRQDATHEEVIEAAKAAKIHNYIMSLPDGYDTIINEDGMNISQGQKQMLTIARAMLSDAKMLILDEATSNVDTRTEIQIQTAMRNLMKDKTCFVIAHRLSTIQNADTILVVQHGDIVEQGNHEQLMRQGGIYANLYRSQFH